MVMALSNHGQPRIGNGSLERANPGLKLLPVLGLGLSCEYWAFFNYLPGSAGAHPAVKRGAWPEGWVWTCEWALLDSNQ
jgi:hypothetical protein